MQLLRYRGCSVSVLIVEMLLTWRDMQLGKQLHTILIGEHTTASQPRCMDMFILCKNKSSDGFSPWHVTDRHNLELARLLTKHCIASLIKDVIVKQWQLHGIGKKSC